MDKETPDMKTANQIFDIAPSQNPVGYSSDTLRRLLETDRITPVHISKNNTPTENPKIPVTLFKKDSSLYYQIKDNIRENYVTKVSGFEVTYDNKVIFHFASIPGGRVTAPVEINMTDNEIINLIKAGEDVNTLARKNQPQQPKRPIEQQELGLTLGQTQDIAIKQTQSLEPYKQPVQSLEPYKQPVQDLDVYKQPVQDLDVYKQPVQDLVLSESPTQKLDENLSLFDLEQIKQQEPQKLDENLSLFDLEQIKQQEPHKVDENLSLFDLEQIKQQELNKQNKNQSNQIGEYEEEENDEILFAPLFPDMTLFQSQQNQPEGFIGSETENTTPDAVTIAEKVENQFKGLSIDGVGDGNEIIIKANGIPEDYNISIKDIGNNNKIILNFAATPINEKEQSQQEEIVKEPEEADIESGHDEEKKEPEPEPRYEPEELKKGSSSRKAFNKPSDGKLLRSFMENFLLPSGVFLALIVIGGASLPLTPILASCVVASGFGMYLFNKNIAAGAMHALQLPGKPLRMLQNLAKNHQSKKEKFLAQEMEYRQTQESQFEKDCKKYLSPEEQRTFSKEDKEIAVAIKKQQEAKPIIIPKDSPKELPSTKSYNDTIYNPGDIPQNDLSTDNDGKKYTVKKDLLASLLKGEGHIFHDDHLFGGGNLHSSNKWKLTEDGIKRQSTMEKGK